jgi:hypothetical protein
MKKIIEFFNNLFGKKWEYVPTEYASPVEQLVASKRSAIQNESVEAKKEAVKKKPAAKKPVAKKTARKSAKKKIK